MRYYHSLSFCLTSVAYPSSFCVHALFYSLELSTIDTLYPNILNGYSSILTLYLTDKCGLPIIVWVHSLFYSLARVIYYWYSNILIGYSSILTFCLTDNVAYPWSPGVVTLSLLSHLFQGCMSVYVHNHWCFLSNISHFSSSLQVTGS